MFRVPDMRAMCSSAAFTALIQTISNSQNEELDSVNFCVSCVTSAEWRHELGHASKDTEKKSTGLEISRTGCNHALLGETEIHVTHIKKKHLVKYLSASEVNPQFGHKKCSQGPSNNIVDSCSPIFQKRKLTCRTRKKRLTLLQRRQLDCRRQTAGG